MLLEPVGHCLSLSMPVILSIIFIVCHVALSLLAVFLINKTSLPEGISPSILIAIIFILINILYEYFFKLKALKRYWSIKKLYYIIPAIALGIIINHWAVCSAYLLGELRLEDISVNINITLTGVLITFIIVAWEELWFRGLFLNYCNKHIHAVLLSFIIGFLFMAVHLLNPEIDLITRGLALWAAGSFLTISYFYFENIWVPLGVHFGNNYFSSMVSSPLDNNSFWGTDGHYSTLILIMLFMVLSYKYRKKYTA